MKKFKISDSEMRLLVLLLSLIIVAAAYFLASKNISAAAAKLDEQNTKDAQKVPQLQQMIANEATVKEQTEMFKQAVQDVIAKYPSDVPEEKAIAIMQDMEDQTEVHIKSMNFVLGNVVPVSQAVADTTDTAATDTADTASDGAAAADAATDTTDTTDATTAPASSIMGYYDQVTVTYECGYDSLKALADYVIAASDRMTMPSMTSSFDSETGLLSGQMTFNLYYLKDTGREYQPPVIHGIDNGVSNIFRAKND